MRGALRALEKRERAFTAFLTAPDAAHEQALCRLLSANEAQSVHLLGKTLRAQQQAIAQLQAQMDDYENYVELWAHEVKTPLALLTLVLDNRRDTLPEAVGFKLDYVRNRDAGVHRPDALLRTSARRAARLSL